MFRTMLLMWDKASFSRHFTVTGVSATGPEVIQDECVCVCGLLGIDIIVENLTSRELGNYSLE